MATRRRARIGGSLGPALTALLGVALAACSSEESSDPCASISTDPPGGCAEPCAEGEICDDGICHKIGPVKACGEARYPLLYEGTNTFYVDAAYGGGDSDGSKDRPFRSLKVALETVPRNAQLAVAAGEYAGPLQIADNVEVRGRCPEMVTVVGPVTIDATKTTLRVVVIGGLTIVPKAGAVTEGDSPAYPTCDESSPAGLTIVADDTGLKGHLAATDVVVAGWCRGLDFQVHTDSPMSVCFDALRVWGNVVGVNVGSTPYSSDCENLEGGVVLQRSAIERNREAGVVAHGAARSLTLLTNSIVANGVGRDGPGVVLVDVDQATIRANRIADNGGLGLGIRNRPQVPFNRGLHLVANEVRANRGAGVVLEELWAEGAVELVDNLITATTGGGGSSEGDGLVVVGTADLPYRADLTTNRLIANARYGVVFDQARGELVDNVLAENGAGEILVQQGASIGEAEAQNALCRDHGAVVRDLGGARHASVPPVPGS